MASLNALSNFILINIFACSENDLLTMGNFTSLSPGQILPIEHYLEKTLPHEIWSKSKLKNHLGSTRFMKVGQIEHETEQALVVKIFVIPGKWT